MRRIVVNPDEVIDLCYLSAADYCFSNRSQCNEYSLDGKFMENSLVKKLEAEQNFGSGGTVDWDIRIKRITGISTVKAIEDQGCDMFFMPAVFVDTFTNSEDHDRSFLPQRVLDTIYRWSTVCPTNVVIASQGECVKWGYGLSGINQNPNRPEATGFVSELLSNGPFGQVNSFLQGGSYQGVFTRLPGTGTDILARDNQGRPTIVYDSTTGDLLTGDIGFFCNSVGPISTTEQIRTSNDVLICNFFNLACRLAESTRFTDQVFELCEDEPVFLPSGERTDELGFYTDTLTAFNGCDSIVRTEVKECIILRFPNIFSPNGDGLNDFFNILGLEKIEVSDFKIFNRWGNLVYDNETPETGWDGNFKGEPAVSDVYVFRIVFQNRLSGTQEIRMGDVTLYR